MTRLALGTAALLLALLDWTAGSTIAEPGGADDGAPPDEMIPADANLEGLFRATAEIGRVAFAIVPTSQGYVLEATNPGSEDRDVEVEVKVLETTQNPMARMAAMPEEVASEKVAVHCPAGQRVRHALQLAGIEPAPARRPAARSTRLSNAGSNAGSNANAVGLGELAPFRTRAFVIAAATPARHAQQRQAQRGGVSRAASSEGDLVFRPAGETVLRFALAPRRSPASSVAQ